MSEIFATQLSAAANVALAVLALVTSGLAFLAWRKQSKEVHDQAEMLRLQADEFRQLSADRERESFERRRAQASQVYMWETTAADSGSRMYFTPNVRNTSQQPVYDLTFYACGGSDWNRAESKLSVWPSTLMPGGELKFDFEVSGFEESRFSRNSGEVTFRDRSGVFWRTNPNGDLEEISKPL
jgi:hypothetical protein